MQIFFKVPRTLPGCCYYALRPNIKSESVLSTCGRVSTHVKAKDQFIYRALLFAPRMLKQIKQRFRGNSRSDQPPCESTKGDFFQDNRDPETDLDTELFSDLTSSQRLRYCDSTTAGAPFCSDGLCRCTKPPLWPRLKLPPRSASRALSRLVLQPPPPCCCTAGSPAP